MDLLKLIRGLDLEKIAADFMEKLKIKPFDMYFVVKRDPSIEEYEILGMAYSERSARSIHSEHAPRTKASDVKILRLDIGHLLTLVEKMGGVQEIV